MTVYDNVKVKKKWQIFKFYTFYDCRTGIKKKEESRSDRIDHHRKILRDFFFYSIFFLHVK